MKKVVLVGGATGREHAIAKQFNREKYEFSAILWADNPFIEKLCTGKYLKINLDDVNSVYNAIVEINPDYVVIGQGEVIQRGLCDMLNEKGIKCIGPTKKLAQLEGSKTFCRDLLSEIDDSLNPKHKDFYEVSKELEEYINNFDTKIVVKCDGVITGPRVRIFDNNDKAEALKNSINWLNDYGHIIVEEFIDGYEIAIMSYTDGKNIIHTPIFKNHKRIGEGNVGENTSGMGTITGKQCFPYISQNAEKKMHEITEKVMNKINEKCGEKYLGSLYGEFLVSGNDVKVIEYNCRFGNPSSMNILQIMKISFPCLCEHILDGTISELVDVFDDKSVSLSVYVVPKDYTLNKDHVGDEVDFSKVDSDLLYCGNMKYENGKYYLKNSRAFAVCAVAKNIEETRRIVYSELAKVEGNVYYRKDIGMKIKKIGFDLDGVILDNTTFKKEKYKEVYNLDFENWQLSANIIDEFVPEREMRKNIGTLASARNYTKILDDDCIELLKKLKSRGYDLYIISRRGLSDNGQEAAWKSLNELKIADYFKEIIFCKTEDEKIGTIINKNIDIFFDDRIGVIDGIKNKIYMPVLFDNFDLVSKGKIDFDSSIKTIKNFKEIGELIKNNE